MRSVLVLVLVVACAPDAAVRVEVKPDRLPADGVSSARVVARPTEDGETTAEGTQVTLSTSLGSFSAEDTDLRTLAKGVSLGVVEARLYAPARPGEAKVRAEFNSAVGDKVQGEARVLFEEPRPPKRVVLECDAKNLGGLVPGAPVLRAECRATAFEEDGTPLPAARLGFMAEAGRLAWEDAPDLGRRLVYSTGATPPRDVPPLDEEPFWTEIDRVRNPRDGVVTLVAYAEGTSAAAPYAGEPYVDADDSGAYEKGELFHDVDGDKEYDGPGSVQVAWGATRLVWSGALAVTPATLPEPPLVQIADGSSEKLVLRLADANLNPLAAGRGGLLTLAAGASARVEPAEIGLGDNAGFELDGAGGIANTGSASGWTRGTRFAVWIVDAVTDSASDENFSISGALWRPLTPGIAGGIAPPRTESLPPVPGVLLKR